MTNKLVNVDLHIHTTASDGDLTFKEVLDMAKSLGRKAVAITDHDSIEALQQARDYANKIGLIFIPGIELSTKAIENVHLLGYGIDINSSALTKKLEELKQKRIERAFEIINKLKRFGVDLDFDINQNGTTGRLHIAKQIVKQGYAESTNEAFTLYLNEHTGKAYVAGARLTPLAGAELIKEAGGYVAIAHPLKLYRDNALDDLIGGLKSKKLIDGLEIYYPKYTENDIRCLQKLADKHKLFALGGSDFHSKEHGLMEEMNVLIKEDILNKLV